MKLWIATLPPKYQSMFNYLIDWCDVPPSKAKKAVEEAIADDARFEKRAA